MNNTDVVTLESLPADPSKAIMVAARQINLSDPSLTLSYGAKTMNEIAQFADSILDNVRVKDSGEVGQNLSDLMLKVKGVDVTGLSNGKKGFLESLPVIGGLFDKVRATKVQFETVLQQIDGISEKLEQSMMGLLKDIEVLEQLYDHNQNFYQELSAYINAGEERLRIAREEELPNLEAEAAQDTGGMAAQKVRDFADTLNRFERRLHDLKMSRTITVQTAPQIRMIQNNDRTLAEKIQTSIMATIPIWKNQMVIALSLHGQKQAANLQKQVSDTTNDLLAKNAEMLHDATVSTAREVERSIVDVQTLQNVHEKLLITIEETMNIAIQGRESRRAAEQQLITMEKDLRGRLIALADQKISGEIEFARGNTAPLIEKKQ